jgi:hypothetical protein
LVALVLTSEKILHFQVLKNTAAPAGGAIRLPVKRNVPCPPVRTQTSNSSQHGVNGDNVECGWTDEEWDDDDDEEPAVRSNYKLSLLNTLQY